MQGYILTQRQCDKCEMPMMEKDGLYECVVCPLVAKRAKKRTDQRRKEIEGTPGAETEIPTISAYVVSHSESNESGPSTQGFVLVETASDVLANSKSLLGEDARRGSPMHSRPRSPRLPPTGASDSYHPPRDRTSSDSSKDAVVETDGLDYEASRPETPPVISSPGDEIRKRPHPLHGAVHQTAAPDALASPGPSPRRNRPPLSPSSNNSSPRAPTLSDKRPADHPASMSFYDKPGQAVKDSPKQASKVPRLRTDVLTSELHATNNSVVANELVRDVREGRTQEREIESTLSGSFSESEHEALEFGLTAEGEEGVLGHWQETDSITGGSAAKEEQRYGLFQDSEDSGGYDK